MIAPVTQPRRPLRLRRLLQEFSVLVGSFPDLGAAFDPDELPLEFILWKGSQLPHVGTTSWTRFSARLDNGTSPRVRSSAAHTRIPHESR